MTSQVKGQINYNHPVEVIVKEGDTERVVFSSEGEAGEYRDYGNQLIDIWFSGSQEVIIREKKKG